MKKIFFLSSALILTSVITVNAQSEKKPPLPPPPPPRPTTEIAKVVDVITIKGKMADAFYNRYPSVAEISSQGNIITLKKKDGTKEKYDLSKKEEDMSFTEKYGVSPIPPPPPPPKVVKETKRS